MEKVIKLKTQEEALILYGALDENLRFAEKEYHVQITARNERLKISGAKKNVEKAYHFFHDHLKAVRLPDKGIEMKPVHEDQKKHKDEPVVSGQGVQFFHRGKVIHPKSKNQEKYMKMVQEKDLVISIGPAGTGKTYLAMAAALDHLKKKQVGRLVLTRPAVEAGESLGFLPGDLAQKVDPYLRPLYDALYDMMDYEEVTRYIERGVIEVAPLAYMRGRTLSDCFVILDEAQNCTHLQMKMFLTRLGQGSKAIVTGDITQIDLEGGKRSGLVEAQPILANIKGLKFVYLDETDVVRHPLVQEIINAYEKFERKKSRNDH